MIRAQWFTSTAVILNNKVLYSFSNWSENPKFRCTLFTVNCYIVYYVIDFEKLASVSALVYDNVVSNVNAFIPQARAYVNNYTFILEKWTIINTLLPSSDVSTLLLICIYVTCSAKRSHGQIDRKWDFQIILEFNLLKNIQHVYAIERIRWIKFN